MANGLVIPQPFSNNRKTLNLWVAEAERGGCVLKKNQNSFVNVNVVTLVKNLKNNEKFKQLIYLRLYVDYEDKQGGIKWT